MLLKRRLPALAAVIAALAVAAPGASARTATIPVTPRPFIAELAFGAPLAAASVPTAAVAAPANPNPSCPAWYHGPTNLATGCPYWLMS
jgi:hypothetical protein